MSGRVAGASGRPLLPMPIAPCGNRRGILRLRAAKGSGSPLRMTGIGGRIGLGVVDWADRLRRRSLQKSSCEHGVSVGVRTMLNLLITNWQREEDA
jgi:hypothetical protein